jgi:hypothetical protein
MHLLANDKMRHRVKAAFAMGMIALVVPLRPPADIRGCNFVGRWRIELTTDSVRSLPSASTGRPLTGTLDIVTRDSLAEAVVYSGTYRADFRTVGLARTYGEMIGGAPPGDTIRFVLDPSVDHGNIELVGHVHADSLVGRWIRTGAPARAWGHFVLRRVTKSTDAR